MNSLVNTPACGPVTTGFVVEKNEITHLVTKNWTSTSL